MPDPVLTIEHLWKAYPFQPEGYGSASLLGVVGGVPGRVFHPRPADGPRRPWALRDVSLSAHRGEVIGLIGPDGAGKTTLLKTIGRLTEPTEGQVRLRGRAGAMLDIKADFHPDPTARENVFLRGVILGMSRQEIQDKFDEIADFCELRKFLDTPFKFYSLGMFVRLSFAVAAHLESEILLVDELLAFGDERFREKCMAKMKQLAEAEGRVVLFVSHDMEAVSSLCRRTIHLEHGRVVADGPTDEVIRGFKASSRVDQVA